jgi:putative RecB family exonuclease
VSNEGELKPPPYLSASSISTFRQCPQKFKFNKIDLIPDEPGEAAIMGNFVHDVLEEMYKAKPEHRDMSLAKTLARELWEEKWAEEALKVLTKEEQVRNFRWNAWWCIENLWNLEDPQKVTPAGLETEVNGPVGGVMVKGFIDRFSQSEDSILYTVSDYKTGKTPKKQYMADKFFQLYLYAHLLSVTGIGEVDKIELLYLKDGVRLGTKVKDSEVKEMIEIVQNTKEEIDKRCKTGKFEANKSILCNWCSYKKICPAWNNG